MKIVIGCDPNAEQFKQQLISYIESLGHEVTDYGSELAKCLVKEYLSNTFDPKSRSLPKVIRNTVYEENCNG